MGGRGRPIIFLVLFLVGCAPFWPEQSACKYENLPNACHLAPRVDANRGSPHKSRSHSDL